MLAAIERLPSRAAGAMLLQPAAVRRAEVAV
jgi:hypothetical protein